MRKMQDASEFLYLFAWFGFEDFSNCAIVVVEDFMQDSEYGFLSFCPLFCYLDANSRGDGRFTNISCRVWNQIQYNTIW
jgi:hypothetical protein